MTPRSAAPVATYVLALCGLVSLMPVSGEGTTFLLVAAGALVAWAVIERRTSARIPRNVARAADVLAATLVVALAATNFALRDVSLVSLGYVLAASQLARAFRQKTPRDLLVMHGTAVAQVALAAFLTRQSGYLGVLSVTVLAGVLASLTLPAGASLPGELRVFLGRPVGKAGARARIGSVALPVFLSLSLLAIGTAVFVFLPRGAPFRKADDEKAAAGPAPFAPDLPGPSPQPGRNPVTGFTEGVTLGQIGEIKRVPREAFTVKLTSGGLPARTDDRMLYFRGAVLDTFDGRAWTRDEAGRANRWITTAEGRGMVGIHPELAGRRAGTLQLRQEYRLRASSFRALPMLGRPVGIELGENLPRVLDLGYDAFAAEGPHTEGFVYEVLSTVSRDPMRPELFEPLEDGVRFLRMYPDSTALSLLARDVAGEGDSLQKIARLTDWLQSECAYTLRFKDRPPARPLEHFLFQTRAGHCEYFASALAMMLRAVGVPTRLVTGFRGGLWIESTESYFVRMSDAHAWVEAWVEGRGWVRLDPTPADSNAVAVPDSRVPGGEEEPVEEDWLGERLSFLVRDFGPEERSAFLDGVASGTAFLWREGMGVGRPHRSWPPPIPVLALAVVLLVVGIRLRASLRRSGAVGPPRAHRRSPLPPPTPFYEDALRVLSRAGFARRGVESPAEFRHRVLLAAPIRAAALSPITAAFERSRYGLVPHGAADLLKLTEAVRRLEGDLAEPTPGPAEAPPGE